MGHIFCIGKLPEGTYYASLCTCCIGGCSAEHRALRLSRGMFQHNFEHEQLVPHEKTQHLSNVQNPLYVGHSDIV